MALRMDSLKSIAHFWVTLAEQFQLDTRDIDTVKRRTSAEGKTFLFDTLSQLGRAFDQVLITGQPLDVSHVRVHLRKPTKIPVLMNSLFLRVLAEDGSLLADADPVYIKRIRQLCLLCYKTKDSDGRDTDLSETVVNSFTERDAGLKTPTVSRSSYRKARGLIGRLLGGLDPLDSIPRHGSGSTACRTANHDKYHSFRFIPRLNEVFPYDEFFFLSPSHLCDQLHLLLEAETVTEPTGRLVAVPKDRRGPRLICCEPREFQYIQQGLMRQLYSRVESHKLTAGFVNFTDQTINQRLALQASIDGKLATIDLKDASDSLQWDVVRELFPSNWVRAFDACRTRYVELPDGTSFGPLRKFAAMGSAVCFPVEALAFWALLRAHLNVDVYVYGDDIIVPVETAKAACSTLEAFGLKVNYNKTCFATPFRESCGGEYYNGFDVGYAKLRHEIDNTIEAEVSTAEFVNELSSRFGPQLGVAVGRVVEDLYGPLFRTSHPAPFALVSDHKSSNDVFFRRRYSNDLQRYEYLVPVVHVPSQDIRSETPYHWGEFLRKTLEQNAEHFELGCYAVPAYCTKKYRWRTP